MFLWSFVSIFWKDKPISLFFLKAQIHKKVKTNNLLFYDSTSIFLWCFWHNPTPTEESFQPSDFYRLSRIYSQEHFPTPAGILRLSQAS